MERVIQGRSATLFYTFESNGDPVAPTGTPTFTVVNDAGITLLTGNMAGAGTGPWTITLSPAETAQLDWLTVTRVATIGGQPQTYTDRVEVAGGFLFSIAEATSVAPGATPNEVTRVRTRVEQDIEAAVGYAFVPRYSRATFNGNGNRTLRLAKPFVRRIRSVTVAGVALTAADVAALGSSSEIFVTGYGYGAATVGYEHGLDGPEEPVRAAALDYARFLLTQDTSIDSRAERLVTDDGTLIFAGGGSTPVPSVNQFIRTYSLPGFA